MAINLSLFGGAQYNVHMGVNGRINAKHLLAQLMGEWARQPDVCTRPS